MVSLIVLPICHLVLASLYIIYCTTFKFLNLHLSVFLISPEQPWESLFSGIPHQRGMILKIYDFILALSSKNSEHMGNGIGNTIQ